MNIRQAQKQDATAIATIWNHEVRGGVATFNSQEKTTTEIVQKIAGQDGAFLVAEKKGQVIGFATFFPFRNGVGYAHCAEHTVYLDAAARGHGAGRALMTSLESAARNRDIHVLVAGVAAENKAGIAFHAALGFVETGRMPQVAHKFGRWMDLVLMQKNLQ